MPEQLLQFIVRRFLPRNATLPSVQTGGATRSMKGEVRSLTGLRGFAAVMVMFYHFARIGTPGSWIATFVGNGYLWVDLFFVLSGFVLAYTYQDMFAGGYRRQPHLNFLAKRLARIYPLYLVVIVESATAGVWRTTPSGYADFSLTLLSNLGMVQAWGLARSLEGDAWSISTEWAAYLLFPVLCAATLFAPRKAALAMGLAAAAAVIVLAATPGPYAFPFEGRSGRLDIYSSATPAPLVRCLAEFSMGLLAFRAARWQAQFDFPGAAAASLVFTAALIGLMSLRGYDVLVVAVFPALLISLVPQRGIIARLLGSRGPYLLGEISYSLYLLHDKFSRIADKIGGMLAGHIPYATALANTFGSALAVGCATITYVLIEKPCRRLFRKDLVRAQSVSGVPLVLPIRPGSVEGST